MSSSSSPVGSDAVWQKPYLPLQPLPKPLSAPPPL
uniref:Uncharacterized protein n=1 Tax=Moniliophthora roreri TaxID=221103 RepID=A0A0W0FFX3_MONRR